MKDQLESLRKEKDHYHKKISDIKQRTQDENIEAENIREEIPQIKENIAHRQKQHEILLAELMAQNQQDQMNFESTKANDEQSLKELEYQLRGENEELRQQYAEIKP